MSSEAGARRFAGIWKTKRKKKPMFKVELFGKLDSEEGEAMNLKIEKVANFIEVEGVEEAINFSLS